MVVVVEGKDLLQEQGPSIIEYNAYKCEYEIQTVVGKMNTIHKSTSRERGVRT
jgi:hypothetical protein